MSGGAPVVLATAAPGARRRCRRFAAEAGIVPEREYLAFPTAAAPGCLIEDARPTIGLFLDSVLVVPPRAPLAPALRAAVALLRAARAWRLLRVAAPGRVVVGWRR
jgi:hypothetical protein